MTEGKVRETTMDHLFTGERSLSGFGQVEHVNSFQDIKEDNEHERFVNECGLNNLEKPARGI